MLSSKAVNKWTINLEIVPFFFLSQIHTRYTNECVIMSSQMLRYN